MIASGPDGQHMQMLLPVYSRPQSAGGGRGAIAEKQKVANLLALSPRRALGLAGLLWNVHRNISTRKWHPEPCQI